jgi:RNA polymerase sigma factor for flagellar operon FliA
VDESPATIAELWQEYKEGNTRDARERLILHYSPLVKFVAGRVAAGLPQNIDQSDLVSYGIFGLIDAIDKFDPGRGFKFETYAISRIKGAIIDELRSIDWVPRRVRADARAIEGVRSRLESELCHSPSHAEIAAELGLRPAQLEQARAQIAVSRVLTLDELITAGRDDGTSTTVGETIADPADPFENMETNQSLAHAINTLPERDRLVVTLYYYEQLRLADIGAVLGITESRVCQIHAKAMVELRRQLAKSEREHRGTRARVSL